MDANTEELLNEICDKKTREAIQIISCANQERAEKIKKKIIGHFKAHGNRITYEEYMKIVGGIESEVKVSIHRRSNFGDLDEIDDI